MERNSKAIVWAMMTLLLIGMSTLALNIRPVNANPGCVTITVQYADSCPRSNADVRIKKIGGPTYPLGLTDENGTITRCDLNLSSGTYQAFAYYPSYPTQFGPTVLFEVNATGDGSATITADYEITRPKIVILSPTTTTYNPVSLTFKYDDYSEHSWYGYNLDNSPTNVTILGNTTLGNLALGPHNVIVYANDTYGNMGNSSRVYFSVAVHDISIVDDINISSPRIVNQPINISVTIQNNGGFNETFDVSVNYTTLTIDPLIGNQTITLEPGESITLNFTWTPIAIGQYEIKAYTEILEDINPEDNTKIAYVRVGSSSVSSGVCGGSVPLLM